MNMETAAVQRKKSQAKGWILFAAALLVLTAIACLFTFGLSVQVHSGNAMEPSISSGDKLLVTHILYTPKKGDSVLAEYKPGQNFIKRIIAGPNDTVAIEQGVTYVNGKAIDKPSSLSSDMKEITLPPEQYFLVGDNREVSIDSRMPEIGTFSEKEMKGKVLAVLPF
ncbi:signal peptidase I [Bacillus sp. FJAT-42376]|uniref:signal peptidase I n=1 Tax=Bacillus sp. FJAT-42376 TaxID=2014076 RepID=UPI000F4D30FA|nr:signal peptidase I [Bacillus sp. FJAT-42376]AZB44623.1 signal peptidase I [Bacillus sp. FJAT-42376]